LQAALFHFYKALKLTRQWIVCDCQTQIPAVMTVCQREQCLYLRRISSFAEHHPHCPFYRDRIEAASSPAVRKKPESSTLFGLYKASSTITTHSSSSSGLSQSPSQRLPTLARRLFRLLDDAKLLAIPALLPSLPEQYQAIKKTCNSIRIASGVYLSDYFWTHPAQLSYAKSLLGCAQSRWPAQYSPHGFMLLLADACEDKRLTCQYKNKEYIIETINPIKLSSGRLGAVSAPFLVLMSIAQLTEGESFTPLDAYAIPVYSKSLLMPVESSYERKVLKSLLSIAWSLEKKGIALTIEKPMFDIEVGDSWCRPDFILRHQHHAIVIEVMGSHEDEYLTRKQHTHATMKKLGDFIEIDAYAAEAKQEWDERLSKLARTIYACVFSRT
jgi:hypothetical protein